MKKRQRKKVIKGIIAATLKVFPGYLPDRKLDEILLRLENNEDNCLDFVSPAGRRIRLIFYPHQDSLALGLWLEHTGTAAPSLEAEQGSKELTRRIESLRPRIEVREIRFLNPNVISFDVLWKELINQKPGKIRR